MKAIILAAGMSKRLRPVTNKIPKCLLKLDEATTILSFQIENLIKVGIKDIIIVVGYRGDFVVDYLSHKNYKSYVNVVFNKSFSETDNAHSLSLALDKVNTPKESVIILDGDVVFDVLLIKKLLLSTDENVLIAINDRKIEDEDSKVKMKNGYAVEIGKKVKGEVIYASMIKMSGEFLSNFKEKLKEPKNEREWYSGPLNRLLSSSSSKISVIFTNGLSVTEVDTFEDLIYARKIYKKITSG
jgi:choline kinase